MDNLVITNNAAKKIIELSKKKEKKVMRITVTGGGCQGFQYNLDMENSSKEKDIVVKKNSAIVVIDKNSLNLIKGSEIDFVEDLIGSRFKFYNPKATSSCGCGTSLSLLLKMANIRIASWNVNSIRARFNVLSKWL